MNAVTATDEGAETLVETAFDGKLGLHVPFVIVMEVTPCVDISRCLYCNVIFHIR